MDLGYRGHEIIWLVESGVLTLGYQSTSYQSDRIAELGFADLPFLFQTTPQARAAMDGELGAVFSRKIEEKTDFRILGYFENGFRHLSNRLRPIRLPGDLKGMRIRVLLSDVQVRTFELLGAIPLKWDLTEAIAGVKAGTIDAQENPFANTVTYGVYKFHKFHTLTNHVYLSRPIFLHRPSFDGWPEDLQDAMRRAVGDAVELQRTLVAEEAVRARGIIEGEGGEIVEITPDEHAAFVDAVAPVIEEFRKAHGDALFGLVPKP
jgi:TRAP-type C4-dicarboxylate transport system substrate-binding protein